VAVSFDRTDWAQIAGYYDALAQLQPNAVVRLNRAVAAGMAYGPQTGLELAAELNDEPSLQTYYLLPAVRAEFLGRLGRYSEACIEFERAAALTANERARSMLLERATRCRLT
jgi:predicted RNA polymerase sigma factor